MLLEGDERFAFGGLLYYYLLSRCCSSTIIMLGTRPLFLFSSTRLWVSLYQTALYATNISRSHTPPQDLQTPYRYQAFLCMLVAPA
jgi:hypothetical protein